jgi:hypothetical protein
MQNGADKSSQIEIEGKIIIPEERKSPWNKLMDKFGDGKNPGQNGRVSGGGESKGNDTRKQ